MNPLLNEPNDDQRAVLNAIHGEFEGQGRWPIWQYVDLLIKPQGAAATALSSMPRLRDSRQQMGMTYGWTWWQNLHATPTPGVLIQMTVAGLWALRVEVLPQLYIQLVRHCADLQSRLTPSATEEVHVTINAADIGEALFPADTPPVLIARRLLQLRHIAMHELPTMGQIAEMQDGNWTLTVPADIVEYADVESVPEYLNRLARAIEPPAAPFARSADSPFTVPDMVSYLNAVWTATFKRPLFVNVDPARAASLLYDAHTPDEFDSRCSAVADVLARIEVPADPSLQRKGVRPILLLGQWLEKRVPDGPDLRVHEAASILSKIVNIRVGGQHTNERHKAIEAFQSLGLQYPPVDWSLTWATVRQEVVNALDAIRQEVAANLILEDV